jgi:hypothetical protein
MFNFQGLDNNITLNQQQSGFDDDVYYYLRRLNCLISHLALVGTPRNFVLVGLPMQSQ